MWTASLPHTVWTSEWLGWPPDTPFPWPSNSPGVCEGSVLLASAIQFNLLKRKLKVYAGDVMRLIYPGEDSFNTGQRVCILNGQCVQLPGIQTEPVFPWLRHYCCAIAPRAFALLDDTQVQRLIDFSFDHLLLRRRHQLNGMTLHAGDSEAIPFKGKELLDLV